VASTIELAHRLGLRVVAEGVEDEPTLRHLRSLDCDVSQGYLHSRPLPAGDLARWVAAHRSPVPVR
jgi:EAL domain-containing protein (putative c-di-GMP-specific phosphodiesterase class I)